MVKGVNKTVIEVNNTGSKIFDRIVFYVNPAYGNLSARQLSRAVSNFTFQFDSRAGSGYKSLRRKMLMKRRLMLSSFLALTLVALGITIALIL